MTFLDQIVQETYRSAVMTRGGVAGEAVKTIILGLVIAIGGAAIGIGLIIAGWIWPWIFLISLVGVFMMLSGGFKLLTSAVQSSKTFHCPRCGTEQTLLASIEVFVCPQCDTRLLLGKETGSALAIRNCGHCGHEAAVAPDHGLYNCSDCGAAWDSSTGAHVLPTVPCEQCGAAMPAMSHVCVSCGDVPYRNTDHVELDGSATSHDILWMYGKSPRGHLIYAHSLLKRLRKDSQLAELAGRDNATDPVKLGLCKTRLASAMMSLEHLCTDPEKRDHVAKILKGLDEVYYNLLRAEHAWLSSLKKKQVPEDVASGALGDLHYVVRRLIAQKMGANLSMTGALEGWTSGLVEFSVNESVVTITGDSKARQKENKRNGVVLDKKKIPLTMLEDEIRRVGGCLQEQGRLAS